jgi:hypothetical protein
MYIVGVLFIVAILWFAIADFRRFALATLVVVLGAGALLIAKERREEDSAKRAEMAKAEVGDSEAGCHPGGFDPFLGARLPGDGARESWPFTYPPCTEHVAVYKLIYTNVPEPKASLHTIAMQARARDKHGRYIAAIDAADATYGCHMPLRDQIYVAVSNDSADDSTRWPYKYANCSEETVAQIESSRQDGARTRGVDFGLVAGLIAAPREDMDDVDAEVGCHSAGRSGYAHEPTADRWPDDWRYKYPPCAATADGTLRPVVDTRVSRTNY